MKVSGKFMFRDMPQSNVFVVIVVCLVLLSALLHVIQSGNHEKAKKELVDAVMANVSLKMGGNKQVLEVSVSEILLYEIGIIL